LLTLVHSLTKGAASRSVSRLARDTVTGLLELYRETSPESWQKITVCKGLEPDEQDELLTAIASLSLSTTQMEKARAADIERFRAADWEAFIKTGLVSKVLSGECVFNRKPLPSELIKLYERLLKHVESILVGQVARQTEATHDLLVRFAEHYHRLQLEERALRFSDVTFRLANGTAHMEPERLAFRMDGGVRHLLLDEFQDTSPVQWRVLRPLAQRLTSGGGSFFCVGDAKQAIYGWRGGVAEIFDALDGQLNGLTGDTLAQSYRSSQPVIDSVNAVFQNLTAHTNLDKQTEPVAKWQRAFPAHSTARGDLAGHVTLSVAPQATDEEEQALLTFQHTAERVRDCLTTTPRASIGVLVRTNTAVARLIYELRARGVQASEEGGNPLIDSPAVELILSLLKLADHPGDRVARFHVAKSPLGKAVELHDYQDDTAASRLAQKIRRQLLDDGYGPAIFTFAQHLAAHCDERDRSRLQQLIELAYEYQPSSTLRTSDFRRLVETRRIADPQAADVRVMTIHQAKGLEFDIVFLPELEHRLVGQPDRFAAGRPGPTEAIDVVCRHADKTVRQFFPPALQKLFEDDMCLEVSESLCVLYVAMTRAVHALHMIVAPAKASEKTMPKTFAGLLRATLAAGRPAVGGAMLYEHGDANWGSSLLRNEKPTRENETPAETRLPGPATIQLAPATKNRERGWERISPSGLEGGSRVAASDLLAAKSSVAFNIGTLFHAWLAEIKWLDDGLPSDDVLQKIAARLRGRSNISSTQLADHIARLKRQLTAPSVAAALSRRFYDSPAKLGLKLKAWPAGKIDAVPHRERPFALQQDQKLITGSIDRLVVITNNGKPIAADVIDFKTDEIDPSNQQALAKKVAFYQPQIEAYRDVTAQLLQIDRQLVAGRIVFLNCDTVQSLS
jgi:ATP-dependent helicase/nuclease subunit A